MLTIVAYIAIIALAYLAIRMVYRTLPDNRPTRRRREVATLRKLKAKTAKRMMEGQAQ